MARELDKRDFTYEAVGDIGPESRGRGVPTPDLDPFTGSLRKMEVSASGFGEQSTRLLAMDLAREASVQASGFTGTEPSDFGLPQDVRRTSAGAEVVHLQQLYRGIPVFQSGRTVQFRPGGQAAVTGSSVETLAEAESDPTLDAAGAVVAAANHLAHGDEDGATEDAFGEESFGSSRDNVPLELPSDFQPIQTAAFDLAAQPTVFSAPPFEGPVKASLVYAYLGPEVRLAWQVELVFPGAAADYVVLVAAGQKDPGEILYAANRVCNLLGTCAVHFHNPNETPRTEMAFPLPAGVLPGSLIPAPAAGEWIGDAPQTSGNNVQCQGEGLQGLLSGVLNGNVVAFGPFQPGSDEDHVAHTFYFCNVMHDFFEALGFDEAAGNFEQAHSSGAPGGGDPVSARVFLGPVSGVASMATPADGQSPTMRMGLYGPSNRHTALDSDVVFHEFTHGVSNRLVGERLNTGALEQPQSRGMGEGWSDYFALSFQNALRQNDKLVVGDWVVNNPAGIRGFPYNNNFPDGFGALGTGRYASAAPHPKGEIWCATLTKATGDLATALGDKAHAYAIAWQSVVDGLKLTPRNPSFLDARDAIVAAIDDLRASGLITDAEHAQTRRAFWVAFAHFEMGVNASSAGASLSGIVGDTTLPEDVAAEIVV